MMEREDLQERLDQLRRQALTDMSPVEAQLLAATIVADSIERTGRHIADALIVAGGGEV